MNALGKYCHDFPRLAKESGYKFQLYRGKLNWSDLDSINIQQIIEERNFQMLEQNLIHIINCNLDREFYVENIDKNFVKLFRLAQLGIDYLSYCELYLDRCVILLQEQLSSYQEECTMLKKDNTRKEEELKRLRKKVRTQSQSYKCNKCDKIFMNETYLKSHEKRRHGYDVKAPEPEVITADRGQQTDDVKRCFSVHTQTLAETTSTTRNIEETQMPHGYMKISEQELKIDTLKKDLEELKMRLNTAEKAMEKRHDEKTSFQSSFPGALIPVIHSYIAPTSGGGYVGVPALVPNLPNQFISATAAGEDLFHGLTVKTPDKTVEEEDEENTLDRNLPKPLPGLRSPTESIITAPMSSRDELKEEHRLMTPPQRLHTETSPITKDEVTTEEKAQNPVKLLENETIHEAPLREAPVHEAIELTLESDSESEVVQMSTPPAAINNWRLSSSQRRERRRRSQDVFDVGDAVADKPKSLFMKLAKRKPPTIHELTANLRNSFSQLYSSVARKGVETTASAGDNNCLAEITKAEIIDGLNDRLKELGVDPDWTGIPKETMKQKMKILEHNRGLLTKENRLYPYIRRKLEKHLLKRLKTNSVKGHAELLSTKDADDVPARTLTIEQDNAGLDEIVIYDSDSIDGQDAQTNVKLTGTAEESDSSEPIVVAKGASNVVTVVHEPAAKEPDLSIFQAGKFRESTSPTLKLPNTMDELDTDSDFDEEPFKVFDRESLHTISEHMEKRESSMNDIASFPAKTEDSPRVSRVFKHESILKNDSDTTRLQQSSSTKKKVLFAEEPEIFDLVSATEPITKSVLDREKIREFAGTSLSHTKANDDDDDWSLESEWTVNGP